MFANMNGRQLAGWGYGVFWFGLLFELVNAIVSAQSTQPLSTPFFWIGLVLAFGCVGTGLRMVLLIQHRPW